MAIRKSSNSGIPFGNTSNRPASPSIGQPYFNGEVGRLELYSSNGWQNIVQETPGVSSVTGHYYESDGQGTFVVSGTNFVAGAMAYAVGTNGTEYEASSTQFNSLVQLTVVFSNLSKAYEPYDLKVTNPSNLFGLLPDAFSINDYPVWSTASGSLGTFNEGSLISVSVGATDDENNTITYSLASGSSLPSGVSLNSSTGAITGTLPSISYTTTYNFTINASDGINTAVSREFSITSTAYALPTGGTITTSGSYRIHMFTGNGTFTVSEPIAVEYLIIGGGGAGGDDIGGGGGAGGLISGSTTLSVQSYPIVVGAGGAATTGFEGSGQGNIGNNTTAFGLTALKGGTGGGEGSSAGSGGNGSYGSGGGGGYADGAGGAGTPGQGYSGANASGGNGAGGGGAGGAGSSLPGHGGPGLANSILGTTYYWAGGGGGTSYVHSVSGNGGIGGGGGGSTAGNTGSTGAGTGGGSAFNNGNAGSHTNGKGGDAGANTGGGGGGAKESNGGQFSISGAGGSGVVIVRYLV